MEEKKKKSKGEDVQQPKLVKAVKKHLSVQDHDYKQHHNGKLSHHNQDRSPVQSIADISKQAQSHQQHLRTVSAQSSRSLVRPPRTKEEQESDKQLCSEIMSEFMEEAFDIISSRFLHAQKDLMIVKELRDTWLRIMESEWLDLELVSEDKMPSTFINMTRDKAPMPIDFDFWSRGALEEYPQDKRESRADPLLRRHALGKKVTTADIGDMSLGLPSNSISSSSILSSLLDTKSEEDFLPASLEEDHKTPTKSSTATTEGALSIKSLESTQSFIGDGDAPIMQRSTSTVFRPESIPTIPEVAAKQAEKELEELKAAVSLVFSKSNNSLKPWTISQCGAWDGSGAIFRLARETTSEALKEWEQEQEMRLNMEEAASQTEEAEPYFLSSDQPGTQTIFENVKTETSDRELSKTSSFENFEVEEDSEIKNKVQNIKGFPSDPILTELKSVNSAPILLNSEDEMETEVRKSQETKRKSSLTNRFLY